MTPLSQVGVFYLSVKKVLHIGQPLFLKKNFWKILTDIDLFSISRDLSGWFIQTYYCRSEVFHTEYYKKVNEIIPFIKYLIRTKIILHWEKMNEVKHPELS
jgi:hypothetical protein